MTQELQGDGVTCLIKGVEVKDVLELQTCQCLSIKKAPKLEINFNEGDGKVK